jgi:hypothetical protein
VGPPKVLFHRRLCVDEIVTMCVVLRYKKTFVTDGQGKPPTLARSHEAGNPQPLVVVVTCCDYIRRSSSPVLVGAELRRL